MDGLVNSIVSLLNGAFGDPSMANLVDVVVKAMEIAQEADVFSGTEKKEIVITSVTRFIDEKDMLGRFEDMMIDVVPVMIDNLIAADRQKLKLHPQVVTVARGCFGFCKKKLRSQKSKD